MQSFSFLKTQLQCNLSTFLCGGTGTGEMGWEMYGRREKRVREVRAPWWWEVGEIGKNNTTLYNNLLTSRLSPFAKWEVYYIHVHTT